MEIVVIGNGAHARDIAYCDPEVPLHMIPHHSEWGLARHHNQEFIIGINDPWIRAKVAEDLSHHGLRWVHPTALVRRTQIGMDTHINYMASMVRTTLGKFVTISPGVTICGDVEIGDRVLIGAGAVICDRTTIGSDCTIGAGTIILPESQIPDGTTWVGNPARQIR